MEVWMVERISSLPLDEFINVVENLTQEQWKEFIDKCESYTVKGPVVPIVVDYPIEEDGVDADVLLEKLRKNAINDKHMTNETIIMVAR